MSHYRTHVVDGKPITTPAYVHLTQDGWRISMVGFSRHWSFQTYGGPKPALVEAATLLEKILKEDDATLRSLFNGKVVFSSADGSVTATIVDNNKKSMDIALPKYRQISMNQTDITYDITDPKVRQLVGERSYQLVYDTWTKELRRSFKRSWVKDILDFIKQSNLVKQETQLSLI